MADAPPNAVNDAFTVSKTETFGDIDFNVRTNDTNPSGPALNVFEVKGATSSVGSFVTGSNGGKFKINADGTVDFDAGGDFADLGAGETRTTSVTYGIKFTGAADVVDVMLIQDLSGSFWDDLPNVRSSFGGLYDTLNASRDIDFGVASFIDRGESIYATELAVSGSKAAIQNELNSLVLGSGGDYFESQLDALLQIAKRAETAEISFRNGAQRIVVLSTDAPSHVAGDASSLPPNDGDGVIENEDYASIAQVKAALEAADITPVFSVTADVRSYYDNLVVQLGRGVVTTISSNSANLADAIAKVLTTEVETIDTATVTVTVEGEGGEEPQPPIDCPTVDRPGTQDGSASTNDTLSGPAYHNTFYFDVLGDSGNDTITNFGKDDILVVNQKIADSNNDGIITFGKNGILDLDGPGGSSDTVKFTGLDPAKGLRYLGEACEGVHVYADATVKPKGAIEGKLSNDILSGDALDKKSNIFFYDTALDISLGADRINNFGSKDVLVTTTALRDADVDDVIGFGSNKVLDLSGGLGGPLDPGSPGEVGSIALYGTNGSQITAVEFDGSVVKAGVTYFVYSLAGSAADESLLGF